MLTSLIGRIVIILFGVLHPAYRTYKAIRKKDYQEVVVLGMYWVVFSLFTTLELITDIFLQWFPFYYELKIAFVVWLVTPATSGYSLIYRKFIHPELSKRENEIDEAINRATEKGYTKVVEFGAKGLNYAAKTVLSTALMGQDFLVEQLRRRSASMSDLNRIDQSHIMTRHRNTNVPGAGDQSDAASQLFTSEPQCGILPSGCLTVEDDPFALNWLHPGSTGSLGKQWKPPAFTTLYQVPEDAENGISKSEPTASSMPTITHRRTNITQNATSTNRRPSKRRATTTSQNRVSRTRDSSEP